MSAEHWLLLRRFFQNPGRIGTVCPSSPALAAELIAEAGVGQAGMVVELGPGTGAVTGPLLAALAPGASLLAVELDDGLCRELRQRFPDLTVAAASAAQLPELLQERQLPPADAVISSLPWTCFPLALQREILQAVVRAMAPGGTFVTFGYLSGMPLAAGFRFRRLLKETFGEYHISAPVWRNFPPACVYRCRTAVTK
ncbi:MAG: methyltransferase domain-containing protein [Lentisphaeria bacterium]|nr:methyltransferase domain-containing protein [Lentisphaeria bacterium]